MDHHIFIDNSNIFFGIQGVAKRVEKHVPWAALRLHFRNLATLVEGGQTIVTRNLAGSVPPGNEELWRHAREAGYDTNLLHKIEREDGRSGEQGVDEMLHLKIANLLLDAERPGVLVLVTGDGGESEFGTSFPRQAQRALKRGWRVVVWSWKEQLSSVYADLARFYDGGLSANTLDQHYKSITFVKGGMYGPPVTAKIVNLAERRAVPVRLPVRLAVTPTAGR